jgi:tRNA threonylcarbamoyladenosine biosynthesis protein TsaE
LTYRSESPDETFAIARSIGETAKPGGIYCLNGDLGAGKTVFAKGFACGMGIASHISSPTFCIINEYTDGTIPLYHFDVYRVSVDEMENIGYSEYFHGEGVCLIEWAGLIEPLIPSGAVRVTIMKDYNESDDFRLIKIEV